MTRIESITKKSAVVMVIFIVIGLTGTASYCLPAQDHATSDSFPITAISERGTAVTIKKIAISFQEQNDKSNTIRISLPSAVMIENADREAIANIRESMKVLKISNPVPYIDRADKQINKNFKGENLTRIGIDYSMNTSKADEEVNDAFLIENTMHNFADQKMLDEADHRMQDLFESSSHNKIKMNESEILNRADSEITHNFRDDSKSTSDV